MAELRGSAAFLAVSIIGGSALLWGGVWAVASREADYAPPLDPAPSDSMPEQLVVEEEPAPEELPPSHPDAPKTPLAAEEFERLFAAFPGSSDRRALVDRLQPVGAHADRAVATLFDILEHGEWYLREAAIDVLTRHPEALVPRLDDLATRDARVVEGVLLALGQTGDPEHRAYALLHLTSSDWRLRCAAARALALIDDARTLEPLFATWEKETHPLVVHALARALSRILGCTVSGDRGAWRRWFVERGVDDVAHRPAPVEVREEEHIIDGMRFRVRLRGSGSFACFVLSDLGLSSEAIEAPFERLDPLWRTVFVTLPVREDLGAASSRPIEYPISRVADALDKLRERLARQDPMFNQPYGVVGIGLGGWIAFTHASTRPQRVRRMVLISVSTGTKGMAVGLQALEATAEPESERARYAAARWPGWTPEEGDDEAAAARVRWTTRLADARDLQLSWELGPLVEREGRVRFSAERSLDGLYLPAQFSLFRLERVLTPTLVIRGEHDPVVSKDEANAMVKHYGSAGRLVEFPSSCALPLFEETGKFCEILERFTLSMKKSAPEAAPTTEPPPPTTEAR